jgi:asparagine synthase (glutamine-hydrolysing)
MFAIAVWDRQDRVLWLARDRIGKKPLHYGWIGGSFAFASELKALRAHPDFDPTISQEALAGFLQLGYVLGERTIHAGLAKLPAGHILRLDATAAARCETPAPIPYWSLHDAAATGLEAQASGRAATVEELEALLLDAVARRMVADVPVGAFLSGGIDSSLITALMAAKAPGQVRSFSIGFSAKEWDEAGHARAVAEHLRTQHEELYVTPAETLAMVQDVPGICDEPFADDSIIPTTILCRLARRGVTVAISGDGGDELFGGYQRYANAARWLARREAVPGPLRLLAGGVIEHLARPVAGRWGSQKLERRLGLLGHLLGDGDPETFGEIIMSQSLDPRALLADPSAFRPQLAERAYRLGRSTPIDRLTFMDSASFLIDDILAKVDRASMSTSLEVRAPLLDWRVIEMAWRFPTAAKNDGATGKIPLRSILYRHVPQAMVDRPKMGFSAPVELWVREGLRDWAEALMSREALSRHGLLNVAACRRLWEGYTRQGRGWDRMIWNLLMFQAWHVAMQDRTSEQPALAA